MEEFDGLNKPWFGKELLAVMRGLLRARGIIPAGAQHDEEIGYRAAMDDLCVALNIPMAVTIGTWHNDRDTLNE